MPAPEECKEIEHHHPVNNHPSEDSSSFTKEVFQEAFGELYTEHVKITVKNGDHHGISDRSAFPDQDFPSGVSTFKKTYFGASKSQSMNENLTLKDITEDEETAIEGRKQYSIYFRLSVIQEHLVDYLNAIEYYLKLLVCYWKLLVCYLKLLICYLKLLTSYLKVLICYLKSLICN